jgi:exonuclease III
MMNTNRRKSWNVLNWNIRGINSEDKCNAIRLKLDESNYAMYCIQETKRELFEHSFIRKFAPKRFDQFAYSPSQGNSGGILMDGIVQFSVDRLFTA